MVVEAEHAGDVIRQFGRQVDRAGAGVKLAQLGVLIVEQIDAEGLAEVRRRAAQAQPRRDRFVVGHHQIVGRRPLGDRIDRRGIGAVFGRHFVAGHIGALTRQGVVQGREIGQIGGSPHAQGQVDPVVGVGPSNRFRTGRYGMGAVGQGHELCVRHRTSFRGLRQRPPEEPDHRSPQPRPTGGTQQEYRQDVSTISGVLRFIRTHRVRRLSG